MEVYWVPIPIYRKIYSDITTAIEELNTADNASVFGLIAVFVEGKIKYTLQPFTRRLYKNKEDIEDRFVLAYSVYCCTIVCKPTTYSFIIVE